MRRWAALGQRFDRHRVTIISSGTVYLAMVSAIPVLMTPYRHDDTINRNTPQVLTASGQQLFGSLIEVFHYQVNLWMTRQGRFFPGSVAWSLSVFTVFRTRETYKGLLAFLVVVMVVLVAWLVARLTRRSSTAAVVVVALCATLTLRAWADGLDSFAGLLPLTISMAFGSALLLLRGRGWLSIVLAVTIWSVALITYEVGILLTPTLCLALWLAGRRFGRSLALLWPTLADGLFVLYLRSHATFEAPAYQSNFELARVVPTYLKQSAAALPLSQGWLPGSVAPSISSGLIVMALVLVGIPAALLLTAVLRSRPDPSWRSIGIVALIGATCWLAPAALIAITVRWQDGMPAGQGYLSVVWGYVGVALLLVVGWLALVKRFAGRPGAGARAALVSATIILSVLAALTAAESFSIAGALSFPAT